MWSAKYDNLLIPHTFAQLGGSELTAILAQTILFTYNLETILFWKQLKTTGNI